MNLGVQYYRPPFPENKYWEEDFARIRDSRLNTVQFWVVWAWVESKPGHFCFDDYDRLMELAEKNGLVVILSTIAEIHPYWINREIPGSEMVDHTGRKVISSNRSECHFGLTPGGCFDHPVVWERMGRFLSEVVMRYRSASNLQGWDSWNETRWNVNADGLVCFCNYTLESFSKWLSEKYIGLDGLNKAWKRRYGCFDEILPGKLPKRPYTEMMAFEHFLTWRANQHGKARYDLIKSLDPNHIVVVHSDSPSPLWGGSEKDHAINRGNDWFYADDLDGIGCSSFPTWLKIDEAGFSMRVECLRSAARDKTMWISELQGGSAANNFELHQPVKAKKQQRWIWNAIACGAETILFWCWRDEIFGRESSGYGLAGDDGFAEERLAALKKASKLIEDYSDILTNFEPEKPEVGVMFSPQSYYLNWAGAGNSNLCMHALQGYARSLVRKSIPFTVIEEQHIEVISDLKIVFLPRTIVVDILFEKSLTDFVKEGGTLICESECGAFNSQGFYRYPADRFTSRLSCIREVDRRGFDTDTIKVEIDGQELNLGVTQWLTPWQNGKGRVLAKGKDGALIVKVPVGKGNLVLCGAYLGDAYFMRRTADFEDFVELLVRQTGWKSEVQVVSSHPEKDSFVYIKSGESGGKRVIFVFFPEGCDTVQLRFRKNFFLGRKAKELITGKDISLSDTAAGQEVMLNASEWMLSILVEKN